jgi:TPR repeat protein
MGWWEKAATQGYHGAEVKLGKACFLGRGVVANEAVAVEWWCKAAEGGDGDAQYLAGLCCRDGAGV